MKKVMAFVFAGVRTGGLSVLTRTRSVAAVPFAGKYRLIDFTLSNCVNSELYSVAILAQNSPHSLIKHVGRGAPWDLNRRGTGVEILQPYERQEGRRWYEGTADALRQNLDVLANSGADRVFVLSSELAYKMDYSWMLKWHEEHGAGVTVAVGRPDTNDYSRFGVVEADDSGVIHTYERQADPAPGRMAFMGTYLFETSYLRELLTGNDLPNLFLDCVRPHIYDPARVRAYQFDGEWREVVTVGDYLRANQRLLDNPPLPNLYDPEWRIFTRSEEMPPAWVDPSAEVRNSLLSNGAVIEGLVEHSVLSPGVYVGPNAVVRDSILLNGARIEEGAVVERAIIDKDALIYQDARVGSCEFPSGGDGDSEGTGITVLGKGAEIPRGAVIAPGAVINPSTPSLEGGLETLVEGIFR